MPDTKLSAIATQLSSPAANDRIFAVDDPGGTPSDAYLLWSQIVASGDISEHLDATYSTSVAIGTAVNNANQVTVGANITISTQYATAVGNSAVASASQSVAFGYLATASGSTSTAFGTQASASATNTMAIGASSNASVADAIAIGNSATASAADAIALGRSATASGAQAIAIGEGTSATGTYATAIGENASASSSNTSVGRNAQSTGVGNIAVGRDALANNVSGESVAVGYDAHAEGWRSTSLGRGAHATATSSTAIGWGAYVTNTHTLAIGRGSENTIDANSVELGGEGMRDIYFGVGSKHKYDERITGTTIDNVPSTNPVTLHGPDAYDETGTPTNNIAGGDLQLAAGRGTGTADGGSVVIQTAVAGGVSNNTKNALATVAEFDTDATAGNTRFLIYDVDNATLERVSVGAADSGGSGYKVLRIAN